MPTIIYNKSDLKKLLKKEVSDAQLQEVISLIKPNVDKLDAQEITVEHNADRADMFGVEGLARAVNKYLNLNAGLDKYNLEKSNLSVKVEGVPVRQFVAAAVVKNVKMDDFMLRSIMNIQEVLHETIGRKRRKVAIGMHDMDKISSPISYKGASREDMMTALGEKNEMKLKEILEKTDKGREYGSIIKDSRLWPIFTDSKGIFSFPPILNSERTKITEKTKNIFIEVTGTDKDAVNKTLNIIVTNFWERKMKVQSVTLKHKAKSEITPILDNSVIELRKLDVNKTLGLDLKSEEMIGMLKRMGHDAIDAGEKIEVIVPAYRSDVIHFVDLIEDIAIAYGYNNFTPKIPNIATIGKADELEKLCDNVRATMIGFGFQEMMQFVLTNETNQFEKMGLRNKKDHVEIENPVSNDYTIMRKMIRPSLIKSLVPNQHIEYPQNIFEIGDIAIKDEKEDTGTRTVRKIAALVCHSRAGYAEILSILEGLLKYLGVKYKVRSAEIDDMISGRAAQVEVDGKIIGELGEVHPQVLENWGLEMPVAAFEISLERL